MSIPPPSIGRRHPYVTAINEAIDRYHDVLTAYVDKGGEDHVALLDRMVERGAVFGGRAICSFLRPQFILRSQVTMMSRALRHFRSAVVKAKEALLESPELLELLALTDGERRLHAINPEYKSLGVVTRLDTILSGEDLSLVELNAEGAFGISYADRLTELFEGFQPMREFSRTHPVTPMYTGHSLVGTILDTWHEFGGTRVPRVAVVDWKEVVTRAEFDIVCEHFQRHGVPARFVDPRELEYVDGELTAKGEGIDLIYRRLLTSDVLARESEVKPLLEAYRARVVCVVNSFRVKLLDKKILFALLQDPRVTRRYTEEEAAAIRKHVPWTRRVEEGKTAGPTGDEIVWERAIKLALIDPSIVQRRVQLPSSMFPEVGAAGELFFSRRFTELDPYLLRGEMKGALTRLSATPVCNAHTGAGTVPTFVIEDG
jgi:hypothetical protein